MQDAGYRIGILGDNGVLIGVMKGPLTRKTAKRLVGQMRLSILPPGFIPDHELPDVPSLDLPLRKSQS